MYLLTWDDHYGDEGNGHAMVGVFDNEDDAQHARFNWKPPIGFPAREGAYDVIAIPHNPTDPDEYKSAT